MASPSLPPFTTTATTPCEQSREEVGREDELDVAEGGRNGRTGRDGEARQLGEKLLHRMP